MVFSSSREARTHKRLVSRRWSSLNFDRVNVLGDDASYGHSGCVNALSWARDGELLLSGGDDRTVQIWRMDPAVPHEYPFVCRSVIATNHTANIFNVQMLPYSSNIVTVAGDGEVQVHGLGEIASSGSAATAQNSRHTCIHRFLCHENRVKRAVSEDSPHLFLTVAEDKTVRQHDLRMPHECHYGSCPPPLLKLNFELSTLSLSPLTPFQFVVAGESAYGYLFDRRQAGRFLLEERGMVENGMTHCVRRFGRPPRAVDHHNVDHITGCRMSAQNGHELLSNKFSAAYSADAVYLYSTLDAPEDGTAFSSRLSRGDDTPELSRSNPASTTDSTMEVDDDSSETDRESHLFQSLDNQIPLDAYSGVPMILPRQRFAGARNMATIKDVNFLGPNDEYVVSGSDDGNLFIWRKDGALHGIFEGDSAVVNVIEGHPQLPLFAASGIDTTIKLFGPVSGPSMFSRIDAAERIIAANARQSVGYRRVRSSI
ncbi:WD40 repeat-like protein [Mycena pura]|uniref:WD40 repeat-like protein n=1 Tax=Mycena pura TaxID=153505 RepID=A0AAD6YT08_9AGAR|nr:WD40 repeat-like protein [Mycena pura]